MKAKQKPKTKQN